MTKTKLASEVATEDGVDATIKTIDKDNPGVVVHKIVSQVDQTRAQLLGHPHTLMEGMALAAAGGLAVPARLARHGDHGGGHAGLADPHLRLHGPGRFSLNIVTLLGLTLVIGILVDDAIVEIENIEKRVYVGMRPYDAAIEGADQIGLAVVATTFAIVAVFLPVGFMPGIPGQFFREFGLTVSVAVLFSLVVARLLTPLMAAYFLTPKPARERPPLPRLYTRTLTWALDHRWLSLLIGTVIFFLVDGPGHPAEEGRPAGGQSQLLLRQYRGAAGQRPSPTCA